MVDLKELYLSSFGKPGLLSGQDPAWLNELRSQALDAFRESGFPTPKDEFWRYTDLGTSLLKHSFTFDAASKTKTAVASRLKSLGFAAGEAQVAVFVNGRFSKEHSSLNGLPKGVTLQSLAASLSESALRETLNQVYPFEGHPLTALNTAFFTDGLFLQVHKGLILSEPVHAVYVSTASGKATQSHLRNLVLMEDDSRATLIEHYLGDAVGPYLTNVVTEVRLTRGAELEHIKIQQEDEKAFHIGTLAVKQEEGSRLSSQTFSFGAALARNEVQTTLADRKAECSLEGLYLVKGKQHSDNRTFIDHLSPACKSEEFFKGVLDGEGVGIMDGHILVRENAQKTDARQKAHNLQLSKATQVYSKPQLHIYADDVKCSHGSATGQLAEEALFYLQSRGIGREEARKILVYAFADEMLERVKSDYVKGPLRVVVQNWMSPEGKKP